MYWYLGYERKKLGFFWSKEFLEHYKLYNDFYEGKAREEEKEKTTFDFRTWS